MKQLLQILVLQISFLQISFAQEKTIILDSDIKIEDGRVRFKDLVLYVYNYDKAKVPVRVSILCTEEEYKKANITPSKLDFMIMSSNYSAMYDCKNKYTYTPREIDIFFYDTYGTWSITTKYTAQNDYGATKDGSKAIFFDTQGDKELSDVELIKRHDEIDGKGTDENKSKRKRRRE